MNYKYSIIIPIYNTEKYLNECLESLYNQSYDNFEVIMVNDGSTDGSKKICEKYCSLSKRFKLINQENSGVSKARNYGISHSIGEYILFIDSDDYIDYDMMMEIESYIDNNDLLIFGYDEVYKNKNKKMILNYNIKNLEIIRNKMITSVLGGFLCNKVFKRKIIVDNNMFLNEKICYCEDLLFSLQYLNYCKSAIYLNKNFYKYRMRKSGASFAFYNKKNITIFNSYNHIISNICLDNQSSLFIKQMYIFNYYRLKKFINNEDVIINSDIMLNEKKIIKQMSNSMKFKVFLCKHCLFIFKFFQYLKHFKYKLYE